MNFKFHQAESRGHVNFGWLNTHHTFSFGSYMNPERMNFGALRVLNDDVVIGGGGFGTHPHSNMEIISIPLQGDLEHKDSIGNLKLIRENDVQVMSAGTGIYHSEYNASKTHPVHFLQIWIFPNKHNIEPSYEQKTFLPSDRQNKFNLIVSPDNRQHSLKINQQAFLSLGRFEKGYLLDYIHYVPDNGIYVFLINGEIKVNGIKLSKRDGIGIEGETKLQIECIEEAELLVMEVPMS